MLCAALAAVGCESDTERGDEEETCDPNVAVDADLLQCVVEAFVADVAEIRTVIAQACAGIATDLGQTPPSLSSPPTDQELSDACSSAGSALGTAYQQAACPTMNVVVGGCSPDSGAQAACQQACSGNASCLICCDLVAPFEVVCTPPTVTVDTTDAMLQMTLEENLPPLLQIEDHGAVVVDWAVLIAEESVIVLEVAAENGACESAVNEAVIPLIDQSNDASASFSAALDALTALSAAATCTDSTP